MLRLFRDIDGSKLAPQGSVACIGAFDGLHLGHQALIEATRARAEKWGVPLAVVCFEPLPREYFATPERAPRLMLPGERLRTLAAAGVDVAGQLRFNAVLVAMSAREFVKGILIERLAVREVLVGPGFRFGHGREGDLGLLQAMGAELGFTARAIEPVFVGGERVSSTVLRAALREGDFAHAERLLGRPYAIAGRVVRGQQLGRTLGFPTANLAFDKTPALQGVFAVRVHGVEAAPLAGVASFGTRPTVGGVEPALEAHIFDYEGDLYGRRICVEFIAKLRDEAKFDSLAALTTQMHEDAARARAVLATAGYQTA